MTRPLPRLHAVTSDHILTLPDLALRARAVARAPTVALHARAGTIGGRRFGEYAALLKSAGAALGASVFVNDRADVAVVLGADGVHLPAKGLPIAAVRTIVGPDMWIGRSTHSVEDAQRAACDGADYLFLGPVWETTSHPDRPPLGPDALKAVTTDVPVIAIGGVTPDRVQVCLNAGAYGVAAVSALWLADDPRGATEAMLLSLPHGSDDNRCRQRRGTDSRG